MTDFDTFWNAYPRKIGKGDARKAFVKAIKLTDMETILAAIDRYKSHKPDWQNFCHPGTWLRQERWEDDWTEPEKKQTGGAPRSFEPKPGGKVIPIRSNYKPAFLQQWEAEKKTGGE